MRWVWIRPKVLAPQMKKVPNRIQNTGVRDASLSAVKAAAAIALLGGGAGGCGCEPSSP